MVRVNIILPEHLSDQHLIAEYREILFLFGYYEHNKNKTIKQSDDNLKHPYMFYQDKLLYLKKRHYLLREEMIQRGFKPNITIRDNGFDCVRINDWVPDDIHVQRVKQRITKRINEKPNWYRYCGDYQPPEFFEGLMNERKR